jgi:hypothetical protein
LSLRLVDFTRVLLEMAGLSLPLACAWEGEMLQWASFVFRLYLLLPL